LALRAPSQTGALFYRSVHTKETTMEAFETNFYGAIRVTQAFAPILAVNGGGAIINVVSDVTWLATPVLAAYAASKAAAWSFTNIQSFRALIQCSVLASVGTGEE
jgi:short-subunit dehydrogenase